MSAEANNKLILAILQGDDYADTVSELTHNGFFVTLLNTTGGFLRKKSTTVMIGVSNERLQEVLDILKHCAGHRKQTVYHQSAAMHQSGKMPSVPLVPVTVDAGGVTVFILDLQSIEKF